MNRIGTRAILQRHHTHAKAVTGPLAVEPVALAAWRGARERPGAALASGPAPLEAMMVALMADRTGGHDGW